MFFNQINNIDIMRMTITLLMLAFVLAAVGFGGMEGMVVDVSRVVFYIFLVLIIVSAIAGKFIKPNKAGKRTIR